MFTSIHNCFHGLHISRITRHSSINIYLIISLFLWTVQTVSFWSFSLTVLLTVKLLQGRREHRLHISSRVLSLSTNGHLHIYKFSIPTTVFLSHFSTLPYAPQKVSSHFLVNNNAYVELFCPYVCSSHHKKSGWVNFFAHQLQFVTDEPQWHDSCTISYITITVY